MKLTLLAAEVAVLENVQNDPESLANRLHDFDDRPPEKQTPPELPVNPASANGFAPPAASVTSEPVGEPNPKVQQTFVDSKPTPSPTTPVHGPISWIMSLPNCEDPEGDPTSTPIRQSLPKLKLNQFDGDPLLWSDWSSMFKSIIHDTNISLNAKMQHLQNSLRGKAKAAVEGFGYCGDSYGRALQELESRFRKPHVVVKATLDKLRRFSRLQEDKFQDVRSLSDAVSSTVWTLKRLGYTSDITAEANLSLALDKLTRELRIKWKEHAKLKSLAQPTLEDFSNWLKDQAEIYEECNNGSAVRIPRTDRRQRPSGSGAYGSLDRQTTCAVSHQSTPSCIMGDGAHKLYDCSRFKSLSVKERFRKVRQHGLCFCCLGRRHQSSNCRLKKPCGRNGCTQLHHTLLHPDSYPTVEGSGGNTPATNMQPLTTTENSNTSHVTRPSVLLQVVPITLYGPKGYLNTFGLLDTGSTCSLILSDVANRLGLEGPPARITLNGIQRTSELSTKRVSVRVSPAGNVSASYDVDGVLVVDRLNVPDRRMALKEVTTRWPHLSDLELPEVDGSQVAVLLGSDVAEIIVPLEVRCGPKGAPIGVRTKLGWTVTGRLPGYLQEQESVFKVHCLSPDEDLHDQVRTWWKTEDFGCKYDSSSQRSVEDQQIQSYLDEKVVLKDGRYEVPLLWKTQDSTLPNNRILAVHRLNLLEKRLRRDPTLAASYASTIQSDREKSYVQKLTKEEAAAPLERQWYLPHHPVLNPNKPGKIRRVCDAASKFQGVSLNDHLVTGPDLLNSLTGILF